MNRDIITLAAAYLANNKVPLEKLPDTLVAIKEALENLRDPVLVPAVPIEESVHDDYLVCLEDGAEVKLLRRYLKTHHGMTDEQYIERWGLPEDYPFVPSNYSTRRSGIAKENGLGKIK